MAMKNIIVIMTMLSLIGCAMAPSKNRPASYYSNSSLSSTQNLFETNTVLSDETIDRILNYRLKLPKLNRIAIVKLSNDSYWSRYSSDFSMLTQNISKNFIGKLNSSERIYDASYLPSMLMPNQKTLPFLRAAAARYQADLLLVYNSNCQSYSKVKLIDPNVSKAYCTIEAAIIDVRKGLVPFSAVSTNQYTTMESSEDINFSETKKKAELSAIERSLSEIASGVTKFLSDVESI